MVGIKTFISDVKPMTLNALWLKPIEGGFAAYLINGGITQPLKLVDDNGTEDAKDDKVKDIIGSVRDEKTANTINGAKAYAKDLKKAIIGSPKDASSDLTLYGLKTLIEEKTSKKAEKNGSKSVK